jgi:NADH-quinone oxidoreductase subunit H
MTMMLAVDIGWGRLAIKTSCPPSSRSAIIAVVFLLKMMAHMQSRLGPMDPGGFHGWFQLFGDGIKFIQKEGLMPAVADRRGLRRRRGRALDLPVFARHPAGPTSSLRT